ncbi:MAG: hypothetical protein GX662_12595 [Trichococcus flocculiformis]|uniref:Uncharacterized protein n=1 Tax=Trichococcus flocculiformis TaxID=82803 RepID=A0A847D6Z3_9LACT|nr:hypothetical protein [Trichococcus flocculiformis]NLD33071.1 hypothetical protein [Trichococcus flocculiformis]
MIYQFEFEHGEITSCVDCPCYDITGGCQLDELEESSYKIPADCPLVAVSETETTSCEWCEIASACEYEVTFFRDGDRWATERSLMPKFCPNCGRRLKEEIE